MMTGEGSGAWKPCSSEGEGEASCRNTAHLVSACEAKLKSKPELAGHTHSEIGVPKDACLHDLAVHASELGFRVVRSWIVRGVLEWLHRVLWRGDLDGHGLVCPYRISLANGISLRIL